MTLKAGQRVRILDSFHKECVGKITTISDMLDGFVNDPCGLYSDHLHVGYDSDYIEPVNEEGLMENLKQGDVLIDDEDNEREVYGVIGKIVFYNDGYHSDRNHESAHVEKLKDWGWKVKGTEPEITEVTLDEVALLKGVPVQQIRIKKED